MSVTSIADLAAGVPSQTTRNGANVNSREFMNLLTTQLQNQNPLDPVEDSDFLAQLAQFSQLEEMQGQRSDIAEMTRTLKAGSSFGGLASASNLIGKEVTFVDAQGQEQAGKVSGVRFAQGGIVLDVGDANVPLSNLVSISDGGKI